MRVNDRAARIEAFLAWDDPWPTTDVLRKLAEAAEHLLDVHGGDTHGYEEIGIAVRVAKERIAIFDSARGYVGDPGLRDPDFPCADYQPVESIGTLRPAGECEGDGHYLCSGCIHRAERDNG